MSITIPKSLRDRFYVDERGSMRSKKRDERRRLCAEYAITSGRQWTRLRKQLRREAKRAP
jgi:hypothetical protein